MNTTTVTSITNVQAFIQHFYISNAQCKWQSVYCRYTTVEWSDVQLVVIRSRLVCVKHMVMLHLLNVLHS